MGSLGLVQSLNENKNLDSVEGHCPGIATRPVLITSVHREAGEMPFYTIAAPHSPTDCSDGQRWEKQTEGNRLVRLRSSALQSEFDRVASGICAIDPFLHISDVAYSPSISIPASTSAPSSPSSSVSAFASALVQQWACKSLAYVIADARSPALPAELRSAASKAVSNGESNVSSRGRALKVLTNFSAVLRYSLLNSNQSSSHLSSTSHRSISAELLAATRGVTSSLLSSRGAFPDIPSDPSESSLHGTSLTSAITTASVTTSFKNKVFFSGCLLFDSLLCGTGLGHGLWLTYPLAALKDLIAALVKVNIEQEVFATGRAQSQLQAHAGTLGATFEPQRQLDCYFKRTSSDSDAKLKSRSTSLTALSRLVQPAPLSVNADSRAAAQSADTYLAELRFTLSHVLQLLVYQLLLLLPFTVLRH